VRVGRRQQDPAARGEQPHRLVEKLLEHPQRDVLDQLPHQERVVRAAVGRHVLEQSLVNRAVDAGGNALDTVGD
jgi:hypothetical protein